ncbi:hypothetical protein D3C81_1805490 [compost metagenome]
MKKRDQPLLHAERILQVSFHNHHIIRTGFHHIDDFTQFVAGGSDYLAAHKVFPVVIITFQLGKLFRIHDNLAIGQ